MECLKKRVMVIDRNEYYNFLQPKRIILDAKQFNIIKFKLEIIIEKKKRFKKFLNKRKPSGNNYIENLCIKYIIMITLMK